MKVLNKIFINYDSSLWEMSIHRYSCSSFNFFNSISLNTFFTFFLYPVFGIYMIIKSINNYSKNNQKIKLIFNVVSLSLSVKVFSKLLKKLPKEKYSLMGR